MPLVAVVSSPVSVLHQCRPNPRWFPSFFGYESFNCYVDEDGRTTCGQRACPECGSPAVTVTELVGGLERGTCECGEEWRA